MTKTAAPARAVGRTNAISAPSGDHAGRKPNEISRIDTTAPGRASATRTAQPLSGHAALTIRVPSGDQLGALITPPGWAHRSGSVGTPAPSSAITARRQNWTNAMLRLSGDHFG